MAVQKHGDMVKLDTSLETCLKTALTALCREKPQEPVKWLAHWLLEHNPNAPKVINPPQKLRSADSSNPAGPPSKETPDFEKTRAGLKGTALIRVLCSNSVYEHVGFAMAGASHFAYIPAHRVGGVGPCDLVGLGHVYHALGQGSAGKCSRVLWISLNNEPWVYINGSPHTLRAISNVKILLDSATGDQLQVMEEMLKSDVETEIGNEHGRLQVQEVRGPPSFAANPGLPSPRPDDRFEQDGASKWISVAQGAVRTPEEAVRAAVAAGVKCDYVALPTPPHAPLSRAALDAFLDLLSQAGSADAAARPAVVVCGEAGSSAAAAVQVRPPSAALPPPHPTPTPPHPSPPRRLSPPSAGAAVPRRYRARAPGV